MFFNPSRLCKAVSGHEYFGNYCAKVETPSSRAFYVNISGIDFRKAEKNSKAENLAFLHLQKLA